MYKFIGYTMICIGVVFNQFLIRFISGNDINIESIEKQLFLVLIQLLLVLLGIYIIKKGKAAIQNLSVFFITIVLLLTFIELSLIYIFPFNIKSNNYSWIPYHQYNDEELRINRLHELNAKKNKFGFNDCNHDYKKQNTNIFRIVVLGDSFIWGDGVEDSVIWSRKLDKLLTAKGYRNIEIFHWGKRGMSTLDQYRFLLNEGYKFDIDLLIIGFVVNDPEGDDSEMKILIYHNAVAANILRKTVFFFFQNTFDFFIYKINYLTNRLFGYGYVNWLNNQVYGKKNIMTFSKTIENLNYFLKKQKINFFYVMTPESHNELLGKYFNMVTPIFDKNNIVYLNLYPLIRKKLSKYSYLELGASPSNAHPGNLVTSVYAEEVFKFLKKNKYLWQ